MTQPERPLILLIGQDSTLEYLLNRYALESGHEVRSVRELSEQIDVHALRPVTVWFSSLDVLEAFAAVRVAVTSIDIPIVVCSSVVDDSRASELGADYVFLHPITYDCFLSVLTGMG